jgi:hypothetical protein
MRLKRLSGPFGKQRTNDGLANAIGNGFPVTEMPANIGVLDGPRWQIIGAVRCSRY